MKIATFLLVLFYSTLASGWECPGKNQGLATSIEDHIDLASAIYLGRPTNGYLVADSSRVVFELEISDTFKGRQLGNITLKTSDESIDPSIAIGRYYIFFLYGDNSVNFCGFSIYLDQIDSIEKLRDHIEHASFFDQLDLASAKRILELVE